jgi:hypothetical protein
MKTVRLKPKDVRAFWRYMAKREGFRVVQKADAEEMQAIAWAVKALGGADDWMERYAVTVGNTIYVPFVTGEGSCSELLMQVETCVHEAQHVRQYKRNAFKYTMNYFFSDAGRTHYEADAYRTNMEIHYYFTGIVRQPSYLANKLNGYYVGKSDIYVCKKHLTSAAALIKYGVIKSGVSKVAMKWWNNRCTGHAKVYL